MKNNVKFILASASPRRHELLLAAGIPHEVLVTDADESASREKPENFPRAAWYALEASRIKCEAAVSALRDENGRAFVIAADTVVSSDLDEVLGKPKEDADAVRMLSSLSGAEHYVVGGITLAEIADGKVRTSSRSCVTKVKMRTLSPGMIDSYVATGEPSDKAGAYAIQGLAGIFVERFEGDYSNVVGLSVATLADMLLTDFGFDVTELW
ncbi:MAG: Maf family protein [Clostridia bacterium]|nr:Maf family protein [Clostridia bacterium]